MELPHVLISEIERGNVILLLGAGASIGAKRENGSDLPAGNQLKEMISEEFLGGRHRHSTLDEVSELAASESNQAKVQGFIAKIFKGAQPASFHRLLPTFRWRALVTTNYDCLVETAYTESKAALQDLEPIISNQENIDERIRTARSLPLLKIHGCITRVDDPAIPLVLTLDHFVQYKVNRSRLYNLFKGWACDRPVVFVGHRLRDPNLRAVLNDIADSTKNRPRYYLIKPGATEEERRFWERKAITALNGTFEDFLLEANRLLPKERRHLSVLLPQDRLSIEEYIKTGQDPSQRLLDSLQYDFEHVHQALPVRSVSPERFFKGFDTGWYAIERCLDVPRRLTEILLNDVVLRPEDERPSLAELYLIKSAAGAGKSVLLRRLAWEASTEFVCLRVFRWRTR